MIAAQSDAPLFTSWSNTTRSDGFEVTGIAPTTSMRDVNGGRLNTRTIIASPTHESCGSLSATMPSPGSTGSTRTTRICEEDGVLNASSTTRRSTAPSTSAWYCAANGTLAPYWSTNSISARLSPFHWIARSKLRSMRAFFAICRPTEYTALALTSTGPAGSMLNAYSASAALEAGLDAPVSTE